MPRPVTLVAVVDASEDTDSCAVVAYRIGIVNQVGCQHSLPGPWNPMDPKASLAPSNPVFPFLGVDDPFTGIRLIQATDLVVQR